MAYVYVCDACLDGDCQNCEHERDIPTDPEVCGGGHCVCSHDGHDSKFVASIRASSQSVRERKEARNG